MNISKHMIIVTAIAVIISVGLILSFFVLRPDPEKVTIEAINKQLKLNTYSTTYNLSYSTKAGGLNLNANGDISIIKNNNMTKVSLSLDTFGEKIKIDQYQTPNGVIQCMRSLLNTTCQKVTQDSLPLKTPQEQSEALKQLIQDKVLILSYLSTKTVAGRNCDEIKSVYDPKKAGTLSQESGNLEMIMCLDRDTGMPLEMSMNFDLGTGDKQGAIKINMELKDINFEIHKIDLPEYTVANDTSASLTDAGALSYQ